jgi:mannose-6-phosphate isomerase-like protein (cupin superfamily)
LNGATPVTSGTEIRGGGAVTDSGCHGVEFSMERHAINLAHKFSLISQHWSPKIVARMNDSHFKLVKFQGEFVWHRHEETDEVFIVLDGVMTVHFRNGDVTVGAGEMFVIPRGMEHKTSATTECQAMLVEAAGTLNTGNVVSEHTADPDVWI